MKRTLTQKEQDILFSDFPDADIEYNRETIERYSRNARDLRFVTGRYYTLAEMRERARKAFSVPIK